ncbi:Hpt domain-containing protein [Poseidonocella sp. HB161398]|uniref:Hpt domain-containing protein n=1 Tax=Poseidonocella sp. HB161398 TaxID=2320855 RepID=UPI00110942B2|nr:Hpt domain-containing protein [Poseidonocella sp. HB161398]
MLDWARIEELRDEVGAEDFAEVVELFLEEAGETLGRLGPATAGVAELHFLKGAALNLGFAEFAQLCREAELAARQGSPPDLAALEDSFARTRALFLGRLAAAGYLAA